MRYENIEFQFLSAAEPASYPRGTVVVRDAEMVLEVECPGDERPYTIHGKVHRGFFCGQHKGHPDDVPVAAKWIRLDDMFIGTWVEAGIDYAFTFRLPDTSG
jgi:hypothetical protein